VVVVVVVVKKGKGVRMRQSSGDMPREVELSGITAFGFYFKV
jgi:hypothetical protein